MAWARAEKPVFVNDYLGRLFAAHGISPYESNGWIFLQGPGCPRVAQVAFRAFWQRQNRHAGVLQVDGRMPGGRVMRECFAGAGKDPEAFKMAAEGFANGVFHVLLAAFCGTPQPGRVEVETWEIGGRPFTVFIGGLAARFTGEMPKLPEDLVAQVRAAVAEENLAGDPHWIRLFAGRVGENEPGIEALLDDEPWKPGEALLRAVPWEVRDSYYSWRLFMVLRSDEALRLDRIYQETGESPPSAEPPGTAP